VSRIPEELQPHGFETRPQRAAGEPVARKAALQALFEYDAGAFTRRVEHGSGLGVVVDPAR
jgi:hypothetical protein